MSASASDPIIKWQPALNMFQTQFPPPAIKASKRLNARLLKVFSEEVDSGTSTVNDLFLDRLRELLIVSIPQSTERSRSQNSYTVHHRNAKTSLSERELFNDLAVRVLGIVGGTVLSTQDRSPWKKCMLPASETAPALSALQTHASVFVSYLSGMRQHKLSGASGLIELAHLINEVMLINPQVLVLPLRPDIYNFDVGLKILRARVRKILSSKVLERYSPAESMTRQVKGAKQALEEKVWPILKKCDSILDQQNVDILALHNALLELNAILWYKGATSLMDAFTQQASQSNASAAHKIAPSYCCALVDAPLDAIRDEGLIHTISYFIERNALTVEEIEHVVALISNCFKVLAHENNEFLKWHPLSPANSDPENRDFIHLIENFQTTNHHLNTAYAILSQSLQKRVESVKERQSTPKLWAILLRDAWACTAAFEICRPFLSQILSDIDVKGLSESGLALANAFTHKIHLIQETFAEAEAHLQTLMNQCSDTLAEQERSHSAAAASVAQKLIEGEERKRKTRNFHHPKPEPEPSSPPSEKKPQFVRELERVNSAILHDTLSLFEVSLTDPEFDATFRLGYAKSMQQNVLHFFKQLNERSTLIGEERLCGDVDLLRRILEGTLEFAAAHFALSADSQESLLRTDIFRTHELQKLLIPLLESEEVADNIKGIITAHQEVILALSPANRCIHYPVMAARNAITDSLPHQRTRWLLNYLSSEFDGVKHQSLINQTLHFVSELLKGLQDPSHGPGTIEIIVKDEFDEDFIAFHAISEETNVEVPQKEVGIVSPHGALYGICSMQGLIEIRQMSDSYGDEECNALRDEALQHAALYLRRLSSRLGDTRRLLRSCDSCWGEIDLAQRVIKELLVGSLFHHGHKATGIKFRYENNPIVLADLLREKNIQLPSLAPWLAQVHSTISFPINFDGSMRRGPLAEALNHADMLSKELDVRAIMESVTEFEQNFVFPALQSAWNIIERGFPSKG